MAIYNPKRARELEAAARLAESQRQRELAKGQREQRTTEQILGLVESLIGAAPQVVSGFQDVQAQQVLAGEKPLPEQKPESDDILENIGRFITDPFDAGVRQRVKQMAAERAPAEVAKLQPLTSKAVKERIAAGPRPLDAPSERKELSKEQFEERVVQAMPVEATARYVLDESPVLQLLPERERQALAAGETQRVQAEQAAAERQAKMDEAKLREMAARAGTGKEREKKVKLFVDAALPPVLQVGKINRDRVNSDVPQVANQAIDQIAEAADIALAPAVERGDLVYGSAEYEAAKGQLITAATKAEKKEKATDTVMRPFLEDQSLVKNIVQATSDRMKSKWSPEQEEIIQQMLVEGIDLFGLESVPETLVKVKQRLKMTEDQYAYYQAAMALRRQIMVELNGPGVLSNQDTNELAQAALNPWSTNEEWLASSNAMLGRIRTTYNDRLNAYNGLYAIPTSLIDFGKDMPTSVGEIRDGGKPMGGTPKQQAGFAQRGAEQVVKAFEPIVGAATAMGAQGAEAAFEGVKDLGKRILGGQQPAAAPQTSQQQVQPPPPQQPNVEPEVFYLQQRQGGNLNPSTQSVLVVDTDKGRFLYVVNNDELEAKQQSIKSIAPNATTQVYSGNDAGGL